MEQVVKAISKKYSISDDDSNKLLSVLVEIEKRKQAGAKPAASAPTQGQSKGLLGDLVGAALGGGQGQSGGDDLIGLLGSLMGGGQGQSQSGSAGDMMGLLGSLMGSGQTQSGGSADLTGLLGSLMGGGQGGQAQGGGQMLNILSDLLLNTGGQPGQPSGLSEIVGGLLGSGSGAQGGQGADIMDIVGSLLGGSAGGGLPGFGSSQGGHLTQLVEEHPPAPNRPQAEDKPPVKPGVLSELTAPPKKKPGQKEINPKSSGSRSNNPQSGGKKKI